jgi:hypothetical protein
MVSGIQKSWTGPVGRPRDQDANVDLMVQKMADVMQNQFGQKPKM